MARRGRPRGTDSAQTRQRIVDVARDQFAKSGYAATAIVDEATHRKVDLIVIGTQSGG